MDQRTWNRTEEIPGLVALLSGLSLCEFSAKEELIQTRNIFLYMASFIPVSLAYVLFLQIKKEKGS